MAAALTELIELAVSTAPTAQVNVNHLKDLLHGIVRHLIAGQGGNVPPVVPSSSVAVSAESRVAAADESASTDGQSDGAEATGATKEGAGSGSSSNGRTLYALSEGEVRTLESRLSLLEQGVKNLQSLEKIEEKAAEGGAPLSDMWNFTHIIQRLDAVEQGVTRTCSTVDDIMKELHRFRQLVNENSQKIAALSENLALLQGSESTDTSARSKLQDLENLVTSMQTDLNENYPTFSNLEHLVSWDELTEALRAHIPEQPPQPPPEPITPKERAKSAKKNPSKEAVEALQRVGALTDKHDKLCDEVGGLEDVLSGKLDASALENMLPREAVEALQAKIAELEDKLEKKVLEDLDDLRQRLKALQEATENAAALDADKLNSMIASHEANENLVADMAGQLAQLRERLSEFDRTLSAVQAATAKQVTSPVPAIDPELLEALETQLQANQARTEELTGQMEHIVHDLDVNSSQVQNLYQQVVVLNEVKADREFVTLEVKEKADRDQVQDKASRAWVDSNLHRLGEDIDKTRQMFAGGDQEILGKVSDLTMEMESKLDRLELEPLKTYLEGKIQNIVPKGNAADGKEVEERDAAGLRRTLLSFHCISCARPVYMTAGGALPTLPLGQSMPPQRSIKAYQSFELERIRQQQRLASGIPADDDVIAPTSLRSCGGSYTTTTFFRKPARVVPPLMHSQASPYALQDLPAMTKEANIVGQDGQIYRGRGGKEKLPSIPSKGKPSTPQHRSKYGRPPRTAPPQSSGLGDSPTKPAMVDTSLNIK